MKQDIIRMAREAGAWSQQKKNCEVEYVMSAESIARLVALVRADEREACALVCIDIANKPSNVVLGVAINCAAAIRARG
jgi:hypothetical protein